jgi:hypothetical protein
MLLYGGFGGPGGNYEPVLNDLWTLSFSGTPQWTWWPEDQGPGRSYATPKAFYYPPLDLMILYMSGYIDYRNPYPMVYAISPRGPGYIANIAQGGPPWSENPSVMYDPLRDRIIVYGGYREGLGPNSAVLDQVWAMKMEDRTWTQIFPSGTAPEARFRHSAVYDPIRDRMVVLGGRADVGIPNETWELSLAPPETWRKLSFRHPIPPQLTQSTAVMVPERDWIIVQGGFIGSWPDNGVWVLEMGNPAAPGCECPDTVVWNGGIATARYVVTQPIGAERRIAWTLRSDRGWPRFPMYGAALVGAVERETVEVEITVPDTAATGANRLTFGVSFAGASGGEITCSHVIQEGTTGTLVSLVAAEAQPDRVCLEWRVAREAAVTVQRRSKGAWTDVRVVHPDEGRIVFEDRDVVPGQRLGYRLRWNEPYGETIAGETWIDVPTATGLALLGIRPNPAHREMSVAFTLPAAGRATLEVFDVSGRLVGRRSELDLSEGNHVAAIAPGSRLAPGLYIVQLTFGGKRLRARAVIIN